MLPKPIEADDNEVQGLMNNNDTDDVSTSLTLSNASNVIPINSTSSQPSAPTNLQNNNNNKNKNRISKRDVNKRIQSYLQESDENCRESATLVAIVVIGLIVTGSVIGFLQLGHHDPHARHKGSHASEQHFDGEELPNNIPQWFLDKNQNIDEEIELNEIDKEETLGIQPLYRNYLLQTMYEYSFQSAIRVDRYDPIFQHVSMTYGGPWNVPPPPVEQGSVEFHGTRRLQQRNTEMVGDTDNDQNVDELNDDKNDTFVGDTDSDTEKDVIDSESNIFMASMENGRNYYSFSFGGGDGDGDDGDGDDGNGYDNNMDEWHCFIFEFANADKLVSPELKKEEGGKWKNYKFRISTILENFDMENGYDFIRIYVNSQYSGKSFTGSFEKEEIVNFIDFNYLNEWNEDDIPTFELCINILTDDSINGNGFTLTTKIEYENPEIVTWQNTDCFIERPSWRNPNRWDGSCGVGVSTQQIIKCDDHPLLKEKEVMTQKQKKSDDKKQEQLQNEMDKTLDAVGGDANIFRHHPMMGRHHNTFQSYLYLGVCNIDEEDQRFCISKDCGDSAVDASMNPSEFKTNPKLKYHFNGIGRIDPTYSDPFKIVQSVNNAINIDLMLNKIEEMMDEIGAEYDDIRVLTSSVQSHDFMEGSKLRLGIKLVRSLILGDIFHVVHTGSSNTAGHDNLFESSYPMQLQSIMRPLWHEIGYKGAAFHVSNRGIGGAIGTDQLAWCVPEITDGDAVKIDVVFWESTMNDAGNENSRKHTMENHIRNVLSLFGGTFNDNTPNRPLWHSVIAGSNGNTPTKFDDKNHKGIYSGYKDLINIYSEYGAGIVEFAPYLGMNPMKKIKPKQWSDEHFYVTWHPGPKGHRIYAEIIAYFYLSAAYDVLTDIRGTINDLELDLNMTSIARPVLEMLDLLQDPPYESGLPQSESTKKCKPLCTDAVHSYCLLGFNPKDNVYDISKYVVNPHQWEYKSIAGNPQPINDMNGGQASIDTKYGFVGNKNSGNLIITIKIEGNNYLLIEKPYADWGGLNDILKKMNKWFTAQIINVKDIKLNNNDEEKNREKIIQKQIGKKLKCETKNKKLWNRDIMEFGCVLKFDYSGKYDVAFTVDTDEDIPICVIASF